MKTFDFETHNVALGRHYGSSPDDQYDAWYNEIPDGSWQAKVMRAASKLLYFGYYRHGEPRRPMLALSNDIIPDDNFSFDVAELYGVDDDFVDSERIRAYIIGNFNRRSGLHSYSILKPPRRRHLFDETIRRVLLSRTSMMPHIIDITVAKMIAHQSQITPAADLSLLCETFDGMYLHSAKNRKTVLQLHYVDEGETFFRARVTTFRYESPSARNSTFGSGLNWSFGCCWDGIFTGIGTNSGSFLMPIDQSSSKWVMRTASGFKFDNRERRCIEMTHHVDGQEANDRVFRACLHREDIELATNLMASVDLSAQRKPADLTRNSQFEN